VSALILQGPPSKRWPLNRSISVAAPALPTLSRRIRHPKIRINLRANTHSWKSVPKPLNHTTGLRLFQGNRGRESLVFKRDYLEKELG
jgi:hypothetical protein